MKTVSMKACAKINLLLSVLDKRPDGYHNIESVMQLLDFGDDVTLTVTDTPGIKLTTNVKELPVDEGNIAYRGVELMQKNFDIQKGFTIHIEKRIPIAAGLAGGSTNAAAVLILINRACGLGLSFKQLAEIGVQLGADVPFCLYGKPALAEGIGEKLTPVTGLSDCYIALVNPGVGVSTAMIYKALDGENPPQGGNVKALLASLEKKDLTGAFANMKNVMEPVATGHCPEIAGLLLRLKKAGADHVMMSGSGATCFGVFKSKPEEGKLRKLFGRSFVAVTKPLT